jgi:DNA polymerase III subunit delta'
MSWSKILGHQRQIDGFRRIVAQRRLAHAYLFVGPPGIGKRLFARELAKALLCESATRSPDALEACDQCEACLLIDAGTHPDLFLVSRPEDKNEIPVTLMQELCRDFAFKTARGKGKVGILDDADDLNEESSNCFLKTLEEPPPGSVFILVGSSSDRQLATIKSRCQMVRFAPLPDDLVVELLRRQGVEDAGMLKRLVRVAAGSPGQALALADEDLWKCRRTLLQAFTKPKIASIDLAKEVIEFIEEAGKESALQRKRAALVLGLLIESFTDALRLRAGVPSRSADSSELPFLESLAQRAEPDKILALLERSLETEAHLGRYLQLSLVVEGLLDGLAQLLEHAGPVPLRYQGFPS